MTMCNFINFLYIFLFYILKLFISVSSMENLQQQFSFYLAHLFY